MSGHTKYIQENQRIGKHAFIGLRKCEVAHNSFKKCELIAAQGHPRSPTLVPIESAYETSY